MDHFELQPVELLVEALSDLHTLTRIEPGEAGVELPSTHFVERVASTSEVEFFAHALATGQTHVLDPEMLTGRTSFFPLLRSSALLFLETFEPFGGAWPKPSLSQALGWVSHWRYCHRLDPLTDELEAHIRQLYEGAGDDFVVDTPIFLVTLRSSDMTRAEALARTFHKRHLDGDLSPLLRTISVAQPEEPQRRGSESETLTTAEAAKIVGVSEWTMRSWRMKGEGPPYHKMTPGRSGRVYYLQSELYAWLRSRKR